MLLKTHIVKLSVLNPKNNSYSWYFKAYVSYNNTY